MSSEFTVNRTRYQFFKTNPSQYGTGKVHLQFYDKFHGWVPLCGQLTNKLHYYGTVLDSEAELTCKHCIGLDPRKETEEMPHPGTYACGGCALTFHSAATLTKHYRDDHKVPRHWAAGSANKPAQCPGCEYTVQRAFNLVTHLVDKHDLSYLDALILAHDAEPPKTVTLEAELVEPEPVRRVTVPRNIIDNPKITTDVNLLLITMVKYITGSGSINANHLEHAIILRDALENFVKVVHND